MKRRIDENKEEWAHKNRNGKENGILRNTRLFEEVRLHAVMVGREYSTSWNGDAARPSLLRLN